MELRQGTRTVLVVDDEVMVKELARDILTRYGYDVLTADGGGEAVELFRKHAGGISVVLLDIVMPGMDGKDVFRHIRRIRPDVKVLVSSGYDQERDAEELLREGAAGFVQKPYRVAELVKVVGDVLDQR